MRRHGNRTWHNKGSSATILTYNIHSETPKYTVLAPMLYVSQHEKTMGLEHQTALLLSAGMFLLVMIPAFLVIYWRVLFPKVNRTALIQHIQYQKEQHATNKAIEEERRREQERRHVEEMREKQERQREEDRRKAQERRIKEQREREEQERKDREYKAYINFVFCDPLYNQGIRRTKSTDGKILALWQKAVEQLDNGSSIHSVVIGVYGKSSSGPTYTKYHKAINKLYSRHKAYIERDD